MNVAEPTLTGRIWNFGSHILEESGRRLRAAKEKVIEEKNKRKNCAAVASPIKADDDDPVVCRVTKDAHPAGPSRAAAKTEAETRLSEDGSPTFSQEVLKRKPAEELAPET